MSRSTLYLPGDNVLLVSRSALYLPGDNLLLVSRPTLSLPDSFGGVQLSFANLLVTSFFLFLFFLALLDGVLISTTSRPNITHG